MVKKVIKTKNLEQLEVRTVDSNQTLIHQYYIVALQSNGQPQKKEAPHVLTRIQSDFAVQIIDEVNNRSIVIIIIIIF